MRVRDLALAIALCGMATSAFAVSDNITATANVQTPLTVTGSSNLDFGDVFPGVDKAIPYTDAVSAGQWDITGQTSAQTTLTFTALPANLTKGADTLPIVFTATSAAHHTSDVPGSATTFDPAVGATANLDATTGDIFVWIGATVQPSASQAAGVYNGTITLDVVYTGL